MTGCGTAESGAASCTPNGTTKFICDPARPSKLVNVDSCGKETNASQQCTGTFTCQPRPDVTPYCDSGNQASCDLLASDAVRCGCPLQEPRVKDCYPAGAQKADVPTVLGYLTTCNYLVGQAETCQLGERCWWEFNDKGEQITAAGGHCAASVDPKWKTSKYYQFACDTPLYMAAQTTLEIDCRCNRSNAKLQECRPGADAYAAGLAMGTGPRIHGINLAKWGGGFLLNGELYAAVHYTGGNAGNLKPGAIYAIDIKTGNRRVISGSYLDPKSGRVDVGSGHSVKGEALPFLVDVKLGTDGQIYAMGSDTLDNVEITRVDPKSGARSLVWRRQSLADGGAANFAYGQCFSGIASKNYDSGFTPLQYAERAFALGEDGSYFVGWKGDGVGVVRISPDGKTCAVVSRWASNNTTKPLADVGTGVTPQYGTISGMLHRKGVVYIETKDSLIAIDDKTGNRSIFSNVGGIGGIGETNFWVDEGRGLFFACGTAASRKCSVHKLGDGNVAQGLFEVGASQPVLPGKYPQIQGAKGALDNDNYNGFGAVALDPDDGNILYFVVLSGVIRYEIDTGNSHFVSI